MVRGRELSLWEHLFRMGASIEKTTQHERLSWKPPLARLLGVALSLFLLSGTASLLNLRSWNAGGVTVLWPSNGFLLGVLLCAPRRQWAAYLTAGFLVDMGINCALANTLWSASYLAACNMTEALVAALFLYRTVAPKPDLTRRRQLLRFLVYGVIVAPAIAAFLARGTFGRIGPHFMPWLHTFQWWFTADALGMAVMTPLFLSMREQPQFLGRRRTEVAGLLLLVSGLSVAVFWQTEAPLLYLLLACLLVLGSRLGLAGSAFGLLAISIIGGFFTTSGHGPLAMMKNTSLTTRDLALQAFVLVSMLVLYVLEVIVGERRRLEQERLASEARFRLLTEVSRDVIALVDLDGKLKYVSPAIEEVVGWGLEELLGGDYWATIHPDDVVMVKNAFKEALAGAMPGIFQYRRQRKDGSYVWLESNIRMYREAATGEPVGYVAVVRDIASRKAAEEKLSTALRMVENLASMDALTGIANRRRFDEVLEQEWRRSVRDGSFLSLLLIDADHFKNYNDIYGHISGDECLRTVAETLRTEIRRPADLLARYGGEEFAVVLPDTDSRGALDVAEKMRSAVESRAILHLGSSHGIVTLSVGCATLTPQQKAGAFDLVRTADSALYRAKAAGRNRSEFDTLNAEMGQEAGAK